MSAQPPPSWTSISVHKETYQRVKEMKRGGESFNELLDRLVETTPREPPKEYTHEDN